MPTVMTDRPPLPWEEAKEIDPQVVAEALGLTPAREGPKRTKDPRKWACLVCPSSDAMHAWQTGTHFPALYCHACEARFNNIEAVMQACGLTNLEALRWLGEQFPWAVPAPLDGWDSLQPGSAKPVRFAPRPPRPPRKSEEELLREAVDALPDPRYPPAVYTALLARLTLGPAGTAYLSGRALDPPVAEGYGFRSVESPAEWAELARFLSAHYRESELALAGFPPDERAGGPRLPWYGRTSGLLIPYHGQGDVVGLHFRSLDPRPQGEGGPVKYQKLTGYTLPAPFNADALRSKIVFIREGELNAYTLLRRRLAAVGVPGAVAWNDEWARALEEAVLVVAWYDDNPPDPKTGRRAGLQGAKKLRRSLVETWGEEWVRRRWRLILTADDPNAMEQAGTLAPFLQGAPWFRTPGPEGVSFSTTPIDALDFSDS